MPDLFDDLYRPRSVRYGDDMATEHTADGGPDRHGFRYFVAWGCTCSVCVAGCERERAKHREPVEREGSKPKPKPWRRADIEPAITIDEWKAARSA